MLLKSAFSKDENRKGIENAMGKWIDDVDRYIQQLNEMEINKFIEEYRRVLKKLVINYQL